MTFTTLLLFVILYATVQSVFGVGLLLFGTPTLLLLGCPFGQALGYLLPCSIAVNSLQVAGSWKEISLRRSFSVFCLPWVVLCLWIAITSHHSVNIKAWVGALLLVTAMLRSFSRFQNLLSRAFTRYSRTSLAFIGIIHGFSNMGGGLLTIFVSSIYREKRQVRANIAYGYLLMACCQLLVILLTMPSVLTLTSLVLGLVAATTYLVVGNRVFSFASNVAYQTALTVFIALFGLLLFK